MAVFRYELTHKSSGRALTVEGDGQKFVPHGGFGAEFPWPRWRSEIIEAINGDGGDDFEFNGAGIIRGKQL